MDLADRQLLLASVGCLLSLKCWNSPQPLPDIPLAPGNPLTWDVLRGVMVPLLFPRSCKD